MELADLKFDGDLLARAVKAADLSSAHQPMCDDYFVFLGKQSEASEELAAPLRFLSVVCSWRLRADDPHAPFESLWSPTSPDSVTEKQLDGVACIVSAVPDHDIRARLADLLWLRQRCHKSAWEAVESYLLSVEKLIENGRALGVRERFRRALQISSQLGRKEDYFQRTLQRAIAVAADTETPNCTIADVLDLLVDYPEADSKLCYSIAIDRVNAIQTKETNPLWERRFWDLAAKFAGQNGDKTANRNALVDVAKTFEREAKAAPSCAIAFAHWQMALHAYRRIPDTQVARARVHENLLKSQEGMRGEMTSMEIEPLDLTDLVGAATHRVAGTGLPVALAELAFATRWQTKADVRRQVEENMKHYPLQHLFASTQLGSTGKVAATAPSGMPHDEQIADERLFAEMCRHYKYFISVVVNGTIEPMRHELLRSHIVTIDDVSHLLRHSLHVPHGREAFWVIGIHAGIHGRFIESLHVLVPQVEHLLRELFNANGLISSSFDDTGIQQEYDLNRLLRSADAERLLGVDLCFVLRVIFVERFGYNLRNELAHGMLSPGDLFGNAAIYGWWLLFRLIVGPVAEIILAESSTKTPTPIDPSDEQ